MLPLKDLSAALSNAAQTHEDAVVSFTRLARLVGGALTVPRDDAERTLREVIQAGAELQNLLHQARTHLAEPPIPDMPDDGTPSPQEALRTIVENTLRRLDTAIKSIPHERLRMLVEELRAGRVVGALLPRQAEDRRMRAVEEVTRGLNGTVTNFPGPDGQTPTWLTWFWSLEPAVKTDVASEISQDWPLLLEFLEFVREENWAPVGQPALPVQQPTPAATAAVPESRGPTAPDAGGAAPSPPGIHCTTDKTSCPVEEPVHPAGTSRPAPPMLLEPGDKPRVKGGLSDARNSTEPDRDRAPLVRSPLIQAIAASPSANRSSEPPPRLVASTEVVEIAEGLADTGSPPAKVTPDHVEPVNPEAPHPPLPTALDRATFLERFWINDQGECEAAPWHADGFVERLVGAQLDALFRLDWRLALTLSRASESFPAAGLAPPPLVQWALDFAHGRSFTDESTQAAAIERVKESVAEFRSCTTNAHDALSACFFLLSPAHTRIQPALASDLVELLELPASTRRFVDAWLEFGRDGDFEELQRAQVAATMAPDDAQQFQLAERQDALRTEIRRLTLAAGGVVQRTHCRQAWDSFIVEALPVLQAVVDGPVTDDTLARRLNALPATATRVFDRGGAKFHDRRRMDRAVTLLVEHAEALLTARSHAAVRPARRHGGALDVALEALRQAPPEAPSWGRVLISLVASRLGLVPAPERNPVFGPDQVAVRPLLLEAWTGYDLTEVSLHPTAVRNARLAAARLLTPTLPQPIEDVPLWLATHRPDLLSPDEDLAPEVARRLQSTRGKIDEQWTCALASLRLIAYDLAVLADLQHELAEAALNHAERVSDGNTEAMDRLWLRHVDNQLGQRTRALKLQLRAEALQHGTDAEHVDAMLTSGQMAALIRSLGGHGPTTSTARVRATLFRPDAARRWPNPFQALQRYAADTSNERDVRAFVDLWLRLRQPLRGKEPTPAESAELRQSFAELFFQTKTKSRVSKVQHRSPRAANHFSFVEMSDVRRWVEEGAPNPNFLPQLSRFQQLNVKVTPERTGSKAFARQIAYLAEEGQLTVVLAPGVLVDQLRAAKQQVAERPVWAALAILDDLDLCRIFNLDDDAPEPLLALMEIVAEQQPWSRFCPFEVVEGQHIKLEMFVGRAKEAEQLAHQATYGRIFSGRRLGKTALLRFVGGNESLRSLPSRNSLHVVFVSIAGMESEDAVAKAIEGAIVREFKVDPPSGDSIVPRDRLERLFKQVLDGSPTASVLCLLDESDAFYANQTSAASETQDSLSWWMSRHAEEARDSANLPRVRFVFCGYLFTDQNRGVWENKGDVLFLKALDPDDAVRLASAPLARMGIDARSQADDIAFRCGRQPAVITRFGKELIEHLDKTRPRLNREMATVEARDVITVFQNNEVQRAIREACWLNFVGHPLGQLVFSGLLMVLKGRAAGAAVEDAPALIRETINKVDPNFDPSLLAVGAWEDVAYQLLRELVDRSLLVQAGFAPAAFRLLFPHHLPVLLQEDPARYMRDALTRIRSGTGVRRPSWVLPEAVLQAITYALGPEAKEMGINAVAVASQWPEPLLQADGGLIQRLQTGEAGLSDRLRLGLAAQRAVAGLEDAGVPLLCIGGAELARTAATRQSSYGDVELVRTGRMTEDQIAMWIQRKRAAEFTAQATDHMRDIVLRTGGIPILFSAVDRWLVDEAPTAPTLDEQDVARLHKRLEQAVLDVRGQLLPGGGSEALTEREFDLVRLVVAACDDHGDDFREALQGELVEIPGSPTIVKALDPADHASLRMLLALGLLPREPLGAGSALAEVGRVSAHDPIRTVLGLQA
jgi:hypothetical protein